MANTNIKIFLLFICAVIEFFLFYNTANAINNTIAIEEIIAADKKDNAVIKKELEQTILDNLVSNITNKTQIASKKILDAAIDTSYIEHDKAISHNNYIVSTVNSRQQQKRKNIRKSKNIRYADLNITESEVWLLYSYNRNKENKQINLNYKQEIEHNICAGLETNSKNLVAGIAYIQALSKITNILNIKDINKKNNESFIFKYGDMEKFYGLVYAVYEFNKVNNNCAFVYGKTKHTTNSHAEFYSREYSMMVSSSYTLSWKKLELDLGMTARLINISSPKYKKTSIEIDASKVNYLSGGALVAINFSDNLSSNIFIITEFNFCYFRNFIENNKRTMFLNFKGSDFVLKQDFNMKNSWHAETKLQMIINRLSVGVIGNYNYYNKNRILYGYSFFIGLNF